MWDLSSPISVLVTQPCPTLCDPIDCIAHQAPLSMEFSKQESWSGLPFLSPRDLPDQGLNLSLLHCRWILYRLSHQGSLSSPTSDQNPLPCYGSAES